MKSRTAVLILTGVAAVLLVAVGSVWYGKSKDGFFFSLFNSTEKIPMSSLSIEEKLKLFENTSNWKIYHSTYTGFSIRGPFENDTYITPQNAKHGVGENIWNYRFDPSDFGIRISIIPRDDADNLDNWIERHIIELPPVNTPPLNIKKAAVNNRMALQFDTPTEKDATDIKYTGIRRSALKSNHRLLIIDTDDEKRWGLVEYPIPTDPHIEQTYWKMLGTLEFFIPESYAYFGEDQFARD